MQCRINFLWHILFAAMIIDSLTPRYCNSKWWDDVEHKASSVGESIAREAKKDWKTTKKGLQKAGKAIEQGFKDVNRYLSNYSITVYNATNKVFRLKLNSFNAGEQGNPAAKIMEKITKKNLTSYVSTFDIVPDKGFELYLPKQEAEIDGKKTLTFCWGRLRAYPLNEKNEPTGKGLWLVKDRGVEAMMCEHFTAVITMTKGSRGQVLYKILHGKNAQSYIKAHYTNKGKKIEREALEVDKQ